MITMTKIKTWWRINTRMVPIYVELSLYYLAWPLRLVVNYALFLTIPIWLAPFFMFMMIVKAFDLSTSESEALTGKIWFWDQWRMY